MRLDEAPLRTLASLVERQATGELICASDGVEVHVYLQRGRVAWATDSEHPFAFTRHLQTSAGIDADGFRDVLESCKRERRPLGETLVAWGLVTAEEIRAALRHQLELALVLLRDTGPTQTLFLDRRRQFEDFDEGLTFALTELLDDAAMTAPPSRRGAAAHPHGGALPVAAAPSTARLLEVSAGAIWAELFEGARRVESAPEQSSRPRFAPDVLERTLLDGAEVLVLRLADGLLAGVALPGPRSLWCRLGPDATVGAAVSALGTFAPAITSPASGDRVEGSGEERWHLGEERDPTVAELRAFLERAPEMVATLVVDASDPHRACAAGRAMLAVEMALDTVRRRARVLAAEGVFEDGIRLDVDAEGVGFQFRSMVTAEPRVWCFGAELAGPPRRTLWVMTNRRTSQGLGWAYLTSLSRSLLRGGGGARG